MAASLTEKDWDILIAAIDKDRCTPFLGAGVNDGVLPMGQDIALKWATKFGYPLEDKENLIRVAQFLAVDYYPMKPKDEVISLLGESSDSRNGRKRNQPLEALARMPFKVFLTTNYDDLMFNALGNTKVRDPKHEICHWNTLTKTLPSVFDSGYEPTVANPLIFHLHGHHQTPASIVISEDDYFDFLVNISRAELLPRRIQTCLSETSLLFIGYGLADWNFRVLLQGLSRFIERGLSRPHFAIMRSPSSRQSDEEKIKAQKYLTAYYQNIDVRVFWGTALEFCEELKERWKKHFGGK